MSTIGLFSDEEDGYNLEEEEVKYKLKLDAPSEPALPVSDDEEIGLDDFDFDDDDTDNSSDKPFDDEPFDAGVEADEDEDPEKYIQQLAGKLGTTLRKYTEDRGEPDFSLEKFAINSVISATNTADMPEDDQKDIIDKVKESGSGVDGGDDTNDVSDDIENDEEVSGDIENDEGLEESSDPKFATGDPNFSPSTPEKGMWENDELSVYEETGEGELKNQMFFNDVFNIYDSVSELLSACDESIDELLSDGHAWAVEHLTSATNNMQNIHQFLKGSEGLFNEVREKQNYTFFQDLKTLRRICFDILNMDVDYLDDIIDEHHDWIPNLAAKSLTHVVDVYDFMYEYVIANNEWSKPMEVNPDVEVSDELEYHLNKSIPLGECVFRYGSEKYLKLIREVKSLYLKRLIKLNENDKIIVEDFTGETVRINGKSPKTETNPRGIKLMVNESISIPKNTYHRVIKGTTDLVVEVTKVYDFDFNDLPPDIIKILKNEYSNIYMDKFDWNKKQDEFTDDGVYDAKAFNEWYRNYESSQFSKNINVLIQKVREDLITIIKRRNAEKTLSKFEELIIPVLGNEVLVEPISKFMEIALLNLHSTNEIEKAYRESKNIIDNDGSINQTKIIQSDIFVGDTISLPNFERFVKNNPEYIGVFNDWKKLFDVEIELSLKDLNAFRNSVRYDDIKALYDYLINLKKGNMGNIKEDESNNPCWDGYEMIGMKGKDGEEVPNCVPVSERLIFDKKNRNFVKNYKDMIKSKLSENFSETKPVIKPGIKTNEPKVSPRRKRIWEAKPAVTPPGKM